MYTEKKKRGRPPKRKAMEFEGMTYEGAINHALNVEHTSFLTKRETAKKYTRQVRQYINEQQMKREREKYRQKKLTQQRKKDTLE